ncbi:regulator of G-protein signaling 9-binding protein [Synchiropus picturatus]
MEISKDIGGCVQCSLDESSTRHLQGECERALEALAEVTSCFQQLATSLGSCADGHFLREEMEDARLLAQQLCGGCTDGVVGLVLRSGAIQTPSTRADQPNLDLTSHIAALEELLADMQRRVPVPFWSIEASQLAWSEAQGDTVDHEDTLEDLMEVEVVNSPTCCPRPCCGLH